MRMNVFDFMKRVYESRIEEVKGRRPVKWMNGVVEYWRESGRGKFGVC